MLYISPIFPLVECHKVKYYTGTIWIAFLPLMEIKGGKNCICSSKVDYTSRLRQCGLNALGPKKDKWTVALTV